MTMMVKGPTNYSEIELCDLSPGDGFINPMDGSLYINGEIDGGSVDCFKLHPCPEMITLSGHLLVHEADISIEWGYA